MSRGTDRLDLPAGWCTYILLCADGSYYCGITSNLSRRLKHHAKGKGGKYTKEIKPAALAWYQSFENRAGAARRERQIKNWSHRKKVGLVRGDARFDGLGTRVWVPLG
ncbi:MAG: GIY-YIG nuclease family protein [Terriglobia bacterium]